MKKVELLSPCGNMECLKSAVLNGADAVYFSGKNFGARRYADNFSEEEIIKAIKFCHLYGVKAYITVNILIYENEMEECVNYVRFLHKNNVDAIIVQDLGLITYLRKKFPNLEIHASTQAHNHNQNGIELLKEIGVKRVVLARELSLDEIKNINVDIEKEVFVHGALCVSYSGCCLFSSMNGNRSGNRGSCVGSCRLPYELLENGHKVLSNGDYLLSTKSLCTIEKIDKLIESGITSFKIEGRMKSPEYVGYVTKLYRNKIDEYYKNGTFNVTNHEITNLKKLYNRDFTTGYLFNDKYKDIMNIKTSNHIGTLLGNVIDTNKKYIKVKLLDDVSQIDAVRFDDDKGMILNKLYNEKGLLVNKVEKGKIALFDNKLGIKKAKEVRKTIDVNLIKMINESIERKINVTIKFKARLNEKMSLSISDGENTVLEFGDFPSNAINSKMDEESIKKHIEKLGNTPFISLNTDIDISQNLFIPIKNLNDLRRRTIEKLVKLREDFVPHKFIENIVLDDNYQNEKSDKIKINVLVRNEEQLKEAINENVNNIYVDSYSLYRKYEHLNNIFYRTPRVNNNTNSCKNMLISDIGMLKYAKKCNIVTDSYLNVTNSSTIKFLIEKGVKLICLSYENNFENIKDLKDYSDRLEIVVYGRPEVMVMKYCPVKMIINKDNNSCNMCYKNKYSLKDKDGNIYPLKSKNHITTVYHRENIINIGDIQKYISLGITNFRIDLTDENAIVTKKIIEEIKKYE